MVYRRWVSVLLIVLLPVLALLSYLLWFSETWEHGWAGDAWITNSYITPFFCLYLYLLWAALATELGLSLRLIVFMVLSIITMATLYVMYFIMLIPYAFSWFTYFFTDHLLLAPLIIGGATVLIRHFILRKFSLVATLVSLTCMYCSGIFGQFLNSIVFGNQYQTLSVYSFWADNDFIHTIKTGSILVLLIIGAGYLFVHDHIKKFFPGLTASESDSKQLSFIKKYVI